MRIGKTTLVATCTALVLSGCADGNTDRLDDETTKPSETSQSATTSAQESPFGPTLEGMPAIPDPQNIYAARNTLSDEVMDDRRLVYVPNSESDTVSVIDPGLMEVIDTFPVGQEPQHVVPSYDLKTLYVNSDMPLDAGSLTPIDPNTGRPGERIPVKDPYNLYFTPDGKFAIVVSEAFRELNFYDPHTWELRNTLKVPGCEGINHMDFTADGKRALVSCEFAGRMAVIDIAEQSLIKTIDLPRGRDGMPQDVKLSPDGKTFYIADMMADGIYTVDAQNMTLTGHIPTGKEAHGLYIKRGGEQMIITNRGEGTISILDLNTKKIVDTWQLPPGASPDMGNFNADGSIFWVSARYDGVVYAIDTDDGSTIATIPVGAGPHGLTVWPQPGRYSTGHTGVMR